MQLGSPQKVSLLLPSLVHPSQARQGLLRVLEPSDARNFWRGCVVDWMEKCAGIPRTDGLLVMGLSEHFYRRDAKRLGWSIQPVHDAYLDTYVLMDAAEQVLVSNDAVILLFAGAPSVPRALVRVMIEALQDHDVVFGPTEQRGYWLLGVRTRALQVMRQFSMGSSLVYSEIVEHCRLEGFTLFVGPTWFELDTVADLRRLALESDATLQTPCSVAPRSVEFVRSILSSS